MIVDTTCTGIVSKGLKAFMYNFDWGIIMYPFCMQNTTYPVKELVFESLFCLLTMDAKVLK